MLISLPAALAQTAPANPQQSLAQPGRAAERESAADIHSFEQVPVSLTQAIGTAESYLRGHAVDASFAMLRGKPVYEVKMIGNGQLWQGTVDAQSGAILGTRSATPVSQLDPKEVSQLSKLRNDRVDLTKAIEAVERRTGGKAIDGVLAQRGATLGYKVEVVKNGAVEAALVNPRDGQVAALQRMQPPGGAMSGSSVPRAPASTLPGGASTDRGIGAPPPGSTQQAPQPR